MKVCVFIDGENLRHSLNQLLRPEFAPSDYLPRDAKWSDFFDYLCRETFTNPERVRAYWYVVDQITCSPWGLNNLNDQDLKRILSKHDKELKKLIEKSSNVYDEARKFKDFLKTEQHKITSRFNGWKTLQNGIAQLHDAVEFRRAGTIKYDLFNRSFGQEKAVDVKLGIDLLSLSGIYDAAIIVSGDGDYVPAVQAVKDLGKQVVNVSFRERGGKLLPGGARSLNQITDRVMTVEYQTVKNYILPGSS